MNLRTLLIFFLGCLAGCSTAVAQGVPSNPSVQKKWVVILVGLPGDEEFAAEFERCVTRLRHGLIQRFQIPPGQIVLLRGNESNPQSGSVAGTRDEVQKTLEKLSGQLQPADAFWMIVLGHGNYDGESAFFHLPGRDADDGFLAQALEGLKCGEQVIWLTNSSSGWFLKRLSRPGRIVVTSTAADFELNATEFPTGFASVLDQDPTITDTDHDGLVSIREIFLASGEATLKLFAADQRIPTETAQLDDNGDGKGTASENLVAPPASVPDPATSTAVPPVNSRSQPDGKLSASVGLAYRRDMPPPSTESGESSK